MSRKYENFSAFYPDYLAEHRNPICKLLHFIGSSMVLLALAGVMHQGRWGYLWLLPLIGYGFAWVGHFVFEKNRPATFRHPFYSLMGDWVMFIDILRGRVRIWS